VQRLAGFEPGAPATEQRLLDFQDRLLTSGLFESAVVEFTPDPAQAAAVPIDVRLREQPRNTLTTGVGISANTGPRVLLEHTGHKPFGWYATASNKFEIGRDRRAWTGEIVSHPLADQYRNLIAGQLERLKSADEVRTTWSARLGRRLEGLRISRLYYGEIISSKVVTAAGRERADAIWANYQWNWRDVDSVILPTRGFTVAMQGGGGLARSDTFDDGGFGRAWGRIVSYLPLGDMWHGEARLELGQVFARDNVGLPDPLLFRAGGDDSVRGYDYRSLGPIVNGVVTSGRVIMTSSVEVARPFTAKLPALWGAAFVDAGQAADNFNALDPVLGYGVGVRYRSPVGPLRVDIAYGQAVKSWRLHLSIGIAL
jgi:translocation and assembly module TamA